MRFVLLLLLAPLLAGCTSMELAQWTSAMDQTAGGGTCAFSDSYGDDLGSVDFSYDNGKHAGSISVTGNFICDNQFVDVSSSMPVDAYCEISVGDVSDTILVPANGYVDDYQLGKSYSSNADSHISCRVVN